MEYWKEIEGFISRYGKPYWVSSLGRFKNGYGKILSFHPHKKGYLMVSIPKDGKEMRWQAHRLVAKAFIPNPNQLPQVNHLDGDKKNNAVSNLEWCTNMHNKQHAIKNGLVPIYHHGEKNYCAHLTDREAAEIKSFKLKKGPKQGLNRRKLAEMYGVTEYVIKDIRAGRTYVI